MGWCYTGDHHKLCCDYCDNPDTDKFGRDASCRKHHCPHGYCQSWAICKTCWAKPEVKARFAAHHLDCHCKENHEQFMADEQRKADLKASGQGVRCSAEMDGELVKVTFDHGNEQYSVYHMSQATYEAMSLIAVATVADFAAIGQVTSTDKPRPTKEVFDCPWPK